MVMTYLYRCPVVSQKLSIEGSFEENTTLPKGLEGWNDEQVTTEGSELEKSVDATEEKPKKKPADP